MLDFYLHTLKNVFNFSGRARRKEYLIFLIGNCFLGAHVAKYAVIALTGIVFFDLREKEIDELTTIAQFLLFFPGLALSIRRLHDVGRSGWLWPIVLIPIVLIPIVNLYLVYLTCIKKGDVGHNQYGPDPKNED
jgi:uncharacterized membrane protein YhaH (DUF805 family)